MNIYPDSEAAIAAIKTTAKIYSNINSLIDKQDYIRWGKKFEKSPEFKKSLLSSDTFNILNLLTSVNLEQLYTSLPKNASLVANNLEKWLSLFPHLLKDNAFKGKIKNLDRDNFLASLSELMVAAYFKQLGYAVKFEHKFTLPSTKGNRDIDLTITSVSNEQVHIEVYSPYMPASNGFVGLNDDDEVFSKKVAFKMDDKFGPGLIHGLHGKILMAVDTQKVDLFCIRNRLTEKSSDDLYLQMAAYLPVAVDGYLFFRGDITATQSFVYEKLVLKN